jgi:hypothetical protein
LRAKPICSINNKQQLPNLSPPVRTTPTPQPLRRRRAARRAAADGRARRSPAYSRHCSCGAAVLLTISRRSPRAEERCPRLLAGVAAHLDIVDTGKWMQLPFIFRCRDVVRSVVGGFGLIMLVLVLVIYKAGFASVSGGSNSISM